ncbi:MULTISPECIES: hypothetical protein [Azorhizobium]|jgi:hypothetical protein|uniref:hypothetical protein n=1 Tax=Azorhizobium TaxID=6 RepID=UPI0010618162|nr:hypothetical protein [Azorhizobium sp. AG788]TDT93714.1 hypothetical protein DFO45_3097 [Azorhizobium sp. AG788]
MRIVITFFRIRPEDGAHAQVGREVGVVRNLDEALTLASSLAQSLAMPQRPDAVTIFDEAGRELHSCAFALLLPPHERRTP